MNKTNNSYIYKESFDPGTYSYKVKVYDGVNIVSVKSEEIKVYEKDVSKPSWSVFENIKKLVFETYNTNISYSDVSKIIVKGNLYWNVQTQGKELLVNFDGNSFYEIKDKSINLWLILMPIILILIIGSIVWIKTKK